MGDVDINAFSNPIPIDFQFSKLEEQILNDCHHNTLFKNKQNKTKGRKEGGNLSYNTKFFTSSYLMR